jgi:hypothetical protein
MGAVDPVGPVVTGELVEPMGAVEPVGPVGPAEVGETGATEALGVTGVTEVVGSPVVVVGVPPLPLPPSEHPPNVNGVSMMIGSKELEVVKRRRMGSNLLIGVDKTTS